MRLSLQLLHLSQVYSEIEADDETTQSTYSDTMGQ